MIRPFLYPTDPHLRRHGPRGYRAYKSYKDWLRDDFCFHCVYCLVRETWYPNGADSFAVEHLRPQRKYPHLALDYENLLYSCTRCNCYKLEFEGLIDPCTDSIGHHLLLRSDGRLEGPTFDGKVLIDTLQLNDQRRVYLRLHFRQLAEALNQGGLPEELRAEIETCFAFPEDLPDLSQNRPTGNNRPDGLERSFFKLRERGELPRTF